MNKKVLGGLLLLLVFVCGTNVANAQRRCERRIDRNERRELRQDRREIRADRREFRRDLRRARRF